MASFKVSIQTSYGEFSVEADSVQHLETALAQAGFDAEAIKQLLSRSNASSGKPRAVNTVETNPSGIPREIISVLDEMTKKDLITAMIYYETPVMTKKEMLSRSKELGKALSEQWLDKKLAEETKDVIIQSKNQDGKQAYKLSEQGRLKTELRMAELLANSK